MSYGLVLRSRIIWLVVAVVLAGGCGEGASDNPADCAEGDTYNDATQLCEPCPRVRDPGCEEGCGFRIVEDERGCPAAECARACDLCEGGEFFSSEVLACVACEEALSPPDVCVEVASMGAR